MKTGCAASALSNVSGVAAGTLDGAASADDGSVGGSGECESAVAKGTSSVGCAGLAVFLAEGALSLTGVEELARRAGSACIGIR